MEAGVYTLWEATVASYAPLVDSRGAKRIGRLHAA